MNELPGMIATFLFGLGIGGLYFWTLWLSARKILVSQTPWRAGLLGGTVRLSFLCGSFALLVLLGSQAPHLIAWLAGFLLVRIITVSRSRLKQGDNNDAIS